MIARRRKQFIERPSRDPLAAAFIERLQHEIHALQQPDIRNYLDTEEIKAQLEARRGELAVLESRLPLTEFLEKNIAEVVGAVDRAESQTLKVRRKIVVDSVKPVYERLFYAERLMHEILTKLNDLPPMVADAERAAEEWQRLALAIHEMNIPYVDRGMKDINTKRGAGTKSGEVRREQGKRKREPETERMKKAFDSSKKLNQLVSKSQICRQLTERFGYTGDTIYRRLKAAGHFDKGK